MVWDLSFWDWLGSLHLILSYDTIPSPFLCGSCWGWQSGSEKHFPGGTAWPLSCFNMDVLHSPAPSWCGFYALEPWFSYLSTVQEHSVKILALSLFLLSVLMLLSSSSQYDKSNHFICCESFQLPGLACRPPWKIFPGHLSWTEGSVNVCGFMSSTNRGMFPAICPSDNLSTLSDFRFLVRNLGCLKSRVFKRENFRLYVLL